MLSLLAAALWLIGFALYHVALRAMDPLHQWHFPLGSDLFVIAGSLSSLGLYLYARAADHDPRLVLNLGLAYMVITAALISQMLHWDPTPHGPIVPTISWIGTTVLIFPAIVPPGEPVYQPSSKCQNRCKTTAARRKFGEATPKAIVHGQPRCCH